MIIYNVIHPYVKIPISKKDNWLETLKINASSAQKIATSIGVEIKSGRYLYVTG